jgi:DNA repair protein SbcC/Rad50
MQILSVTLKNFKIHRDRHFTFQPGVNAICGDNGAGKTSILEAIAWVLFDHDSDYKKDELRSQNTANTKVTVSFISSRDRRTYAVARQAVRGKSDTYEIFDPQLGSKLDGIHKIEDARRWLCDNLGLPPHTDIQKLFSQVIGIPQGTLTLDFLKSATNRRLVFDPILKVETYKQAFAKALELCKYAETQTALTEQRLLDLRGQLQDWPSLQIQANAQGKAFADLQSQQKILDQSIVTINQDRDRLRTEAQALAALEQQRSTLAIQHQGLVQQVASLADELARSTQARTICTTNRSAFQSVESAEASLRDLDQQRQTQTQLQGEQQRRLDQRQQLDIQLAQLQTGLDQLDKAKAQRVALTEPIVQQQALEQELQSLQQQQQQQRQAEADRLRLQQELADVNKQLDRVTADITGQTDRINQLETTIRDSNAEAEAQRIARLIDQCQAQLAQSVAAAQTIAELEPIVRQGQAAQDALQAKISGQAKLTKAIQQLLSDSIAQQRDTLGSLSDYLDRLRQPSSDLADRLGQLQAEANQQRQASADRTQQLSLARAAQDRQLADLDRLQQRQIDLTKQLGSKAPISTRSPIETQLSDCQQALKTLDNPRGLAQLLDQQCRNEGQQRRRQMELQTQVKALTEAIAQGQKSLEPYAELDKQIQTQFALKQTHQAAYQEYLKFREIANRYRELTDQHQTAIAQLSQNQTQLDQLSQDLDHQRKNHDPSQLPTVELHYSQLTSQRDQIRGQLPGLQREIDRLHQALERCQILDQERQKLDQELVHKQALQKWISDARQVYNNSGPRIIQFYLQEIVREADRLFRELMDRPSVALNWTEDYEIQIQEGGDWRNFKTLSGGEQMAAALAVRLALLKVLAEMDCAFFDEPTTNMDRLRRLQLAESLGNLKSFQQLFVISHDDTFETITENVIRVDRD